MLYLPVYSKCFDINEGTATVTEQDFQEGGGANDKKEVEV
jgi:hypothetical protein